MKKETILILATVLGCGGTSSSSSTVNAATDKTFNYGTPAAANSSQTSAVTEEFSSAGDLNSSSAVGFVDVSTLTTAVLGTSGAGFLRSLPVEAQSLPQALTLGRANPALSNANCVVETSTTITFTNCTTSSTSGGTTVTETINGSYSVSNTQSSWDFTFGIQETSTQFNINASLRFSGTLTVTSSTIVGNMLDAIKVTESGVGALEVDEAVILNLGYTSNPFCINSGTLEAKRVWVTRPSGASGPSFADVGGKMTWTGCNQATLAKGT